MKQTIRLTESELKGIIRETMNELGIDKWDDDDFVSYDEFAPYGISGDMRERNLRSSMKKGLSFDQLCPMCHRQLTKNYKQLYWKDPSAEEGGGSSRYYAKPGEGRTPINVGNTCVKHFEKAHSDKYHNLNESIRRAIRKLLH